MTIAWDASTQDPALSAISDTVTHPVGATGQHRIAILSVVWRNDGGQTISAITFAGQVPTLYGGPSTTGVGLGTAAMYYLLAPPTGNQTFSVTWSASCNHVLAVSTYTGVDQTQPFLNTVLTATRVGVGALSINVPSQVGNLVVDCLGQTSVGGGASATVGAGQTQRNYVNAAVGGGSQGDGMSEEAGAATVTMSWTCNTAGAGYRLFAGSLRPYVAPRSRAVSYFFNVWDPTSTVRDGQGARLEPNEVKADAWLQADGYTLGEPSAYPDFIIDPSKSRIVSVSYRKDGLTIKASKSQFADVIVARAAAGRM